MFICYMLQLKASNRWLVHLKLHRVAVGDEGAQAIAAGLLQGSLHGTNTAHTNSQVGPGVCVKVCVVLRLEVCDAVVVRAVRPTVSM